MAIGLLDGKTIFSLPNLEGFVHYFLNPISQPVWKYLMENAKVVLVSASQSDWLNQFSYPVKQ